MDCKFYLCLLLILCGTITVLGQYPGLKQKEVKRVIGECWKFTLKTSTCCQSSESFWALESYKPLMIFSLECEENPGSFCSVDCRMTLGYEPCNYPGCYGRGGCCCPSEWVQLNVVYSFLLLLLMIFVSKNLLKDRGSQLKDMKNLSYTHNWPACLRIPE